MAYLRRLEKPLKAAVFRPFDAMFCTKISSFHRRTALDSENASFSNCVTQMSGNDRVFSSESPFFHRGNTLIPLRMFPLSGIRNFSTAKPGAVPVNGKRPAWAVKEACAALLDYLHSTAGLDFMDAEHMSKSSPVFLEKLLKKVEMEAETGKAVSRFLRYHPLNEFEIFFESIGLAPSQFEPLLPRDNFFLSSDEKMLDNYHVLCNYGIARGKIGKMYKEAREIFRYDLGVLIMKLRAYEALGLTKTSVIKVVSSSPLFLVGDVNKECAKLLKELEGLGIERDWIGKVLSEKDFYDWGRMQRAVQFLMEMGLTKEAIGTLLQRRPDFMLDNSGKALFSLVGVLSKVGAGRKEILGLLLQFPHVQVGSFMVNLRHGLLFLIEIEMDPGDIQKLLRTHTEIFGLHCLKKANSILTFLCVGKRRLCRIIKEDPQQLKNYVYGSKLNPLPKPDDNERSQMQKRNFLLSLGFVEDSKEMNYALKVFRGKGDELQDRFDYLVKIGVDPEDASTMIKTAPHVLNQSIDVIKSKINFLLNDLGFPLSALVKFPSYLSYTVERVKHRFLMYNWLKDRGLASPLLMLSTIIASSDKNFTKRFISRHPDGLVVWENFKKEIFSMVSNILKLQRKLEV